MTWPIAFFLSIFTLAIFGLIGWLAWLAPKK